MCLIAVGKMPNQEVLERAAKQNDDGIGVAWRTAKGVEWLKGLEVKDLLELPEYIKEYCAVHFRWATVGGAVAELVHPFPIERDVRLEKSGKADEILMHNGHVTDWWDHLQGVKIGDDKVKFDPKGPTSDSRTLAHLVWRFGPDILYLVGRGQRIMLWHYKHNPMLYGHWHQDEGTHYSNETYKAPKVTTYAGDYRRSGVGPYGGNYGRSFDSSKDIRVYNRNSDGELVEDREYWDKRDKENEEKDWAYWEAKWKQEDRSWIKDRDQFEASKKAWKKHKRDSRGNKLKGGAANDTPVLGPKKDDDTQPIPISVERVLDQMEEARMRSEASLVKDDVGVDLRTTEGMAEADALEMEALRTLDVDDIPMV